MNIANWDITRPKLGTLRILAQITLLMPRGEILQRKKEMEVELCSWKSGRYVGYMILRKTKLVGS